MRRLSLAIALLLAAAGAQAKDIRCNIDSDYDLTVDERSVIFTRESGTPKWVVMRQGRLFVDDRWIALDAEDSRNIAAFERNARETMPLAREVARAAADIAFTALGEVAAGFSNQPAETRTKLDAARKKIDAQLARSVSANRFNGDALGEGIGDAIGEVVPMVIGDVVGGAVRAAFSGDAARLRNMENLDQQIEARIAPRAKALEQQAERLCGKLLELERLDNALAYRLPGGAALDLLETKPDPPARDQN